MISCLFCRLCLTPTVLGCMQRPIQDMQRDYTWRESTVRQLQGRGEMASYLPPDPVLPDIVCCRARLPILCGVVGLACVGLLPQPPKQIPAPARQGACDRHYKKEADVSRKLIVLSKLHQAGRVHSPICCVSYLGQSSEMPSRHAGVCTKCPNVNKRPVSCTVTAAGTAAIEPT